MRLRLRTGGNTYTTATASHGTVLVLPELANLAYFVGNLATRALLDLAASADSHDPQPAARFAKLEATIAKDPANNIHRNPSFFVALAAKGFHLALNRALYSQRGVQAAPAFQHQLLRAAVHSNSSETIALVRL